MPRWLPPLLAAAPLCVAVPLLLGRSVVLVFALYHVGVCLLVPALIDVRFRRWSWRRHLRHVGLSGPGTRGALALGGGLAAAAGVTVAAFLAVAGERVLAGNMVASTLSRWGLEPGHGSGLVLFMAVVNGPAEELFWRGFVAAELAPLEGRVRRLLVPSILYASYHAVTIPALIGVPWAVALLLGAVLGAGVAWTWLRERTGSVWPALLSHGAASVAYMVFAAPLLPA